MSSKDGGGWTLVILIAWTSLAAGVSVTVESERSVADVLASIEARLSEMANGQCDGQQRMARRMDAFEEKLSRIEEKLEEHLSKLRQGEITKEVLKEPSALELSKKMDSTAEKLFARLGIFEAKSNIQMTSVGVKIQRMERHLGRSMDDTLDKILKIEEKNTQMMENLWTMRVTQDGDEEEEKIPAKFRSRNVEVQLDDQWTATEEVTCHPAPSLLHNLTEAMLVNEKKVSELDGDVEIYTRKVLNAFRELSVEHKAMESNFNKVIGQGNHTHEMIRDGFRRIVQQMKPIAAFDEILQSLHKKVSKFENTIDASFATLLVAQNMFIGLLQRLVTKMDEKSSPAQAVPLHSSSDILWTALESHRKDVGQALHDLVWTVIKVGNDTMEEMSRTFGQLQLQQQQCLCSNSSILEAPVHVTDNVEGSKDTNATATASYEEKEELEEVEQGDEPFQINTPIPVWRIGRGRNN